MSAQMSEVLCCSAVTAGAASRQVWAAPARKGCAARESALARWEGWMRRQARMKAVARGSWPLRSRSGGSRVSEQRNAKTAEADCVCASGSKHSVEPVTISATHTPNDQMSILRLRGWESRSGARAPVRAPDSEGVSHRCSQSLQQQQHTE
eukprot:920360-Rhodomonas_salina.1